MGLIFYKKGVTAVTWPGDQMRIWTETRMIRVPPTGDPSEGALPVERSYVRLELEEDELASQVRDRAVCLLDSPILPFHVCRVVQISGTWVKFRCGGAANTEFSLLELEPEGGFGVTCPLCYPVVTLRDTRGRSLRVRV